MANRYPSKTFGPLLAGAGALFLLTGCGVGGQVRAGMGRYEVGNYAQASDACSEMRGDEASMNDKAHVRYLVYCGLTEYRLGNRSDAARLLAQGSGEYQQGRTSWLKPIIVDEMLKALDDLNGATKVSADVSASGPLSATDPQAYPPGLPNEY